MKKKISIVIPTRFDSRHIIELCLQTIRKYTVYPYRIIIGDVGVDDCTKEFLNMQKDIQVVKCPDPIRPKDYLARVASTPYFMFLHDDVQILKSGWLERRAHIMERVPNTGIVGVIGNNYTYGWKRHFIFSPLNKRFFPLGMLVRKNMQDDLDLFWGIAKGFDTGGIAYLQFLKQHRWKFVPYKFNGDIKHWGSMTWVVKKRNLEEAAKLNVDKLIKQRQDKISAIKELLACGMY